MSSYEPPTLAYRVGLVVTPSSTPQRAAVRISSMSAVSRKIFMAGRLQRRKCVRPSLRSLAVPTELGLRTGRRWRGSGVVTGRWPRRATTARTAVARYPRSRSPRRSSSHGSASTEDRSRRANRKAPGSWRAGRRGRSRRPPNTTPSAMSAAASSADRDRPRPARRVAPCRPGDAMTGPGDAARPRPRSSPRGEAPIARNPSPRIAIST